MLSVPCVLLSSRCFWSFVVFFFKQKTAYEMRISDWSSDVCSSDLHEIETEVDRYIAWPGQALSYYIGELAFIDARRRAEEKLGSKFDLKAFHDAVLSLGSVPISEIDRRVDQLIADGGKGPYADEEG